MATAFQDKLTHEIVNVVPSEFIVESLQSTFEYVLPGVVSVERGEVLVDSRGQGSFQR
jgi:hypothetical protein